MFLCSAAIKMVSDLQSAKKITISKIQFSLKMPLLNEPGKYISVNVSPLVGSEFLKS